MKETACIVAAGKGTRSYHYPFLHKALLPLGNKAVLSRCIESLSKGGIKKFIIALQKGEENQIRSFLENVHSDKYIILEVFEARDGENIGPGKTLELCKEHLNCPFIALGCDTLGDFDIALEGDWITVSKKIDWESKNLFGEYAYYDYKTYEIKRELSTKDIKDNPNTDFFSGVIGVEDHLKFWENSSKWELKDQEKPIYAGFLNKIFKTNILRSWIDTGSQISYKYGRSMYREVVEPKPNQEIYIYKNKVIKFFNKTEICNLLLRRHKLLEPHSPQISLIDEYLISYPFIEGKLLSETKEKKFIDVLLNYFEKQVNKVISNQIIFSEFRNDCDLMWFQKLNQRINDFDAEMKLLDEIEIINGVSVERTKKLLDQINQKNFLDACIPCFFHGDPSPENILFDNQNNLRLIDPRPIFGNNNSIGDLYYELAKLDHALIVNGKLIRSNSYGYKLINGNQVKLWIKKIEEFTVFRNRIYQFCLSKNWSTKNLSLATALTLLSISTVHSNKKYNNFLLLAGKYFLKLSIESFKKNIPINIPFYIN